jgi:hypothetical protein
MMPTVTMHCSCSFSRVREKAGDEGVARGSDLHPHPTLTPTLSRERERE